MSPFVSTTDPGIARRITSGAATMLVIGDSTSVANEPYYAQAWPVTLAGYAFRGSEYSGLSTVGGTSGNGGLGVSGLLTEMNYSIVGTRENLFTGSNVGDLGQPAGFNNRIASGNPALLQSGRASMQFDPTADWLATASAISARAIMYRNATSANGIGRMTVRNSGDTSAPAGNTGYLNLSSVSPAWTAYDFTLADPTTSQNLILEAQALANSTPSANSNFVICQTIVRNGATGLTIIPASNGGWAITHWTDTSIISDAALAGMLPLLGLTDVEIPMGINNPLSQTAQQFQASVLAVVARIRAVLPNVSITFRSAYDVNNAGSAGHLAGFADAYYAAHLLTPNSQFLNLYRLAGTWAQNDALGEFTDHVHPNGAGAVYLLTKEWALLQMAAGTATIPDYTATLASIGNTVTALAGRAGVR